VRTLRLAWLLVVAACGAAPDPGVPPAEPGAAPAAGLSRAARFGLDRFLGASAALGIHSGYVAIVARDGHAVHATTAGWADREARRPMQLDTHFRMASMTKPVTAVAAMILVEEGRLGLDDPVSRTVPAAAALRVATSAEADASGRVPTEPLERPLRVRDLLTFQSGIGSEDDPSDLGRLWAARDLYTGSGSLALRVDRLLEAPLYEQPGTRWRYGWSADVLARVVEVAAGQPFGDFVRERITEPLGMSATRFFAEPDSREGLATLYTQDEARRLVPVAESRSDATDWTPGGSGLVSTAGDYLRFALMLWNGGAYGDARILAPETVAEMTRPHVASGVLAEEGIEGLGWGLGLAVVVDAGASATPDRNGDFFWSGYYGTHFFVSPKTGLVMVILTQNLPSEHSRRPYPVYLAPALAFWGL